MHFPAHQRHGGRSTQIEAVVQESVDDEAYPEVGSVGRLNPVGRVGRQEFRAVPNRKAADGHGEEKTVVDLFVVIMFQVLDNVLVRALRLRAQAGEQQ